MLFERSEFIERFEGFVFRPPSSGRFREYIRGRDFSTTLEMTGCAPCRVQSYKKIYNIIRNNLVI